MVHPSRLGLTSREFGEWRAYDVVDPIGQIRIDMAAAMVSHVVANTARDPKQRREPYRVDDFLIEWGRRHEQAPADPTPEELFLKAAAWAMLGVGTIEEGGAN